jgi:hypothetical protein
MGKSCELLKNYKQEKFKRFNDISELLKSFYKDKEIKRLRGLNDFNYIELLKDYSDEVANSKIIAELLNPIGTHYQKNLFMKLFFEVIGLKNIKLNSWEVYTEYSTDENRRIDILLKHQEEGYIIIENKIYADDQHLQVRDYIKNFIKNDEKPIRLFYLTPSKNKPSEYSLGNYKISNNAIYDNDKKVADYKYISYDDILRWMELSRKEVENICSLKEALSQYIKIVKKIIKKEDDVMSLKDFLMMEKHKTHLADLIENQDEFIKNADEKCKKIIEEENLPSILDDIKKEFRQNIANKIKMEIENNFHVIKNSNFGTDDKMNNILIEKNGKIYIVFFEQKDLYYLKIGIKKCDEDLKNISIALLKEGPYYVLRTLKCFEEEHISNFGKNNIDFYKEYMQNKDLLVEKIFTNITNFMDKK